MFHRDLSDLYPYPSHTRDPHGHHACVLRPTKRHSSIESQGLIGRHAQERSNNRGLEGICCAEGQGQHPDQQTRRSCHREGEIGKAHLRALFARSFAELEQVVRVRPHARVWEHRRHVWSDDVASCVVLCCMPRRRKSR